MAAFARRLAADPARIHADLMRVDERDDVRMTVGDRTCAVVGALRVRLPRSALVLARPAAPGG
jgi:hypothetical protein